MQNSRIKEIKINCRSFIDNELIMNIAENYHYDKADISIINEVLSQVNNHLDESTVVNIQEDCVDVCFSLGSKIDSLSDKFSKEGEFFKQLVLDSCCMELMREAYIEIAEIISEETKKDISGFYFWGDKDCPAEEMKNKLSSLGQNYVSCNEAGVLLPQKSVLYRMDLLPSGFHGVKKTSPETMNVCRTCIRGLMGQCINCRE